MAGRLQGKAALVTGAGTGIGEATAHKLASEGATVVAVGLPVDPFDDVAAAIRSRYGVDAEAFGGDIAEEADAAAVARAVERFGRLDVVCSIAGVFLEVAETQDYNVENFDATLRNNCRSAFLITKFALPHLQRSHGVLLFAGSAAGFPGRGNYRFLWWLERLHPCLRTRTGARAEPLRRSRQRGGAGAGRHRVDPSRRGTAQGRAGRGRDRGDADRTAFDSRRDGERLRLPRL